ncbi:unnamed protein product [Aspergillus oryzae RIB40]|uniref:DNA, SC124 n=1 Tax=Aspergillus oryzae (strain ATCC 42149 / RIB 40) TaxID=510516 RepID=Q2U767_ASPOR|nr:unnamed protein product [Aspergillus oryzae RIB40]BAE62598.1 unnamed protein product [Aspergillus oryzae RIB40]
MAYRTAIDSVLSATSSIHHHTNAATAVVYNKLARTAMHFNSVFSVLLSCGLAAAHMQMSWPYPIRSPLDPQNRGSDKDYDMANPLSPSGSDFPCKGYHKNTPWRATAEYNAGESYNMTVAGAATHSGGSCQLSLSYDDGKTFKVIKSKVGGCPLDFKYDFTMPSDVVNGHALFAWSWFNLVGNREMYMNCANVEVSGGSGSKQSFENNYPDMFVANVGNGCSTVEGKHTVFAHPGKQVTYAGGLDASSPPFPNCS